MDPFEWTDEMKEKESKIKKSLTKQKIIEIIEEEITDLKTQGVPTWGYSAWDIVDVLESIKVRVKEE